MAKKEIAVGLNLLFPGLGQFYLKRWVMGILIFLSSVVCLGWLILEIVLIFSALYSIDTADFSFQLYKNNIIRFATSFLLLIFLGIISIFDAVFLFKNKKDS